MESIYKAIAAACGAIASFFTGMPPLVWVLLGAMSLDYATGLICGALGKSSKTDGGGLSSRAAFEGLMKKVLILIVVGLAALVDVAVASGAGVSFSAITGAVCLWFIASEGLSVLENGAQMGVSVPKPLVRALEVMRDGQEQSETKGN